MRVMHIKKLGGKVSAGCAFPRTVGVLWVLDVLHRLALTDNRLKWLINSSMLQIGDKNSMLANVHIEDDDKLCKRSE